MREARLGMGGLRDAVKAAAGRRARIGIPSGRSKLLETRVLQIGR